MPVVPRDLWTDGRAVVALIDEHRLHVDHRSALARSVRRWQCGALASQATVDVLFTGRFGRPDLVHALDWKPRVEAEREAAHTLGFAKHEPGVEPDGGAVPRAPASPAAVQQRSSRRPRGGHARSFRAAAGRQSASRVGGRISKHESGRDPAPSNLLPPMIS